MLKKPTETGNKTNERQSGCSTAIFSNIKIMDPREARGFLHAFVLTRDGGRPMKFSFVFLPFDVQFESYDKKIFDYGYL